MLRPCRPRRRGQWRDRGASLRRPARGTAHDTTLEGWPRSKLSRFAITWSHKACIACAPDTPQNDVAALFDKYNLLTLAVVDPHGRLAGIITADDVIAMLRHRS